MSRPIISAWFFLFTSTKGKGCARVVAEVPTRLGKEHAERCAQAILRRMPRAFDAWDRKPGLLVRRCASRTYQREQREAARAAAREFRRTLDSSSTPPYRGVLIYHPSKV